MARMSALVPAAAALALLGGQMAVAQVVEIQPLDHVSLYSLDFPSDPALRFDVPIHDPNLAQQAYEDCWRLNENWSFNLGARYEELARLDLPPGTYTVTLHVGDCQASGTYAHTGTSSWFAMFRGPRERLGDGEGSDGDGNSN